MQRLKNLPWIPYAAISLLIVAMTMLLHPFELALNLVNISLLYLFPVLLSAINWGMRPAVFAAALAALAFDFFFVTPILSVTIADLRYLISFGAYMAVATLTASLATRLKRQIFVSKQREAHTATLYALSRQISNLTDIHALLENISRAVSQTVGAESAIYLAHDESRLVLAYRSSPDSRWGDGAAECGVAKLAYDYGETVGYGTNTLRDAAGYYLPLKTEKRVYGVLALHVAEPRKNFTAEQRHMLEALGGLAASAIDRVKLAEEARLAHITAESERLRAAILDSVSHELRTPLATIIGSATGLIESGHLFTQADRMELLLNIRDGALRMNRLVVNLLRMAQIESGMLRLQRNWCDVEDLIGVALTQVKDFLQHRKVHVFGVENSPVIRGDEVLLEQMLVNIISNAIKYSPDHSEITIQVSFGRDELEIAISDQGIGLEQDEYQQIFEKFYRATATKHTTGTGLGLAICKGIVELHQGSIFGKRNEPRGTTITIRLPVEAQHESPAAQ